jgi:hypothetical protein
MSVTTSEQCPSAEVQREHQQNNTACESSSIQLVMTYRECIHTVEVSPELAAWLDARSADLDVCALSILVGCAEFVMDSE